MSGTVRDDRGRPLAEARVRGGSNNPRPIPNIYFATTTDERGRYSGSLPAGTWSLSVEKDGFDRNETTFQLSADTTIDVRLQPGITVSGIISQAVGPLDQALVEILSGPNAGARALTRPEGYYSLHLLPGEFTLRVTKEGYDTVERVLSAFVNTTVNFTLNMTYGPCLRSVTPVLFDDYRSAGGDETAFVNANPGQTWTATTDQPWLTITSPSPQTGPGLVGFRVHPYVPVGAGPGTGTFDLRKGAVMIRCTAPAGENVWVIQKPDCKVELAAHPETPAVFPASGGTGYLRVTTNGPRCQWRAKPGVDWIRTSGISGWYDDFDRLIFIVSENPTGRQRTGTLIVGETVWTVTQR